MQRFYKCPHCNRGVSVEQDYNTELQPRVWCFQCTVWDGGIVMELVKEVSDALLEAYHNKYDHRMYIFGERRFKCYGHTGCGKEVLVQYDGAYNDPPIVKCTCHLELGHPEMQLRPMTPMVEEPKPEPPKKLTAEEEVAELRKELLAEINHRLEMSQNISDMNERIEWLEMKFRSHD